MADDPTAPGMPSAYELEAWRNLERHKGRPLSRSLRIASDKTIAGASALGKRASSALAKSPKAQAAAQRGQETAVEGAKRVGAGARKAVSAVPDGATQWTGAALGAVKQTGARISRAGLSAERVVALHQKRGHDVEALADVRRLDLQQVHKVRGKSLDWVYPASAAASGAGTGLMISGGQVAGVATLGATAAPSAAVVLGALALDATAMLGLASRAVGQLSLAYGYDPEEPSERLFVLSVINAGTAASATAKTAALADVSRLTQALARGKTWELLNQSVVSRVSGQFAKAFGVRLTKKGLGKIVPVVGVVLGGALNWATLEGIVDAADVAYRRRFLLEKYPSLADEEPVTLTVVETVGSDAPEENDEAISVIETLADLGGPDLRQEIA